MKHWWQTLILCSVCILTTSLLVACDLNINAFNDKQTNDSISSPDDTEEPPDSTLPDESVDITPPHQHDFGDWKIVIEPNCTTAGMERRKCNGCDNFEERTIEATDHDYVLTANVPATCTQTGSATYTCQNCGGSYTDIFPIIPHDYITSTVAPTCTKEGYTLHHCQTCNNEVKTDMIPATGHNSITQHHAHICKYCHLVTYDTPIMENLDGSYWFLDLGEKSWAIYFDTFEFDGFNAVGTFSTYTGNLDTNGIFVKSTAHSYSGTYELIKIDDTYQFTFTNTDLTTMSFLRNFNLESTTVTDTNSNTIDALTGKIVSSNSTLIFAGYNLQYNNEH